MSPPDETSWAQREAMWKRKLRRLRFGAEPIERQVERYRRATLVLTAVCAGLAAMFLALFLVFARPDIGAILVAILLLPIVVIAWVDFLLLRRNAAGYVRERDAFLQSRNDATR